jgi:hypothetical protein
MSELQRIQLEPVEFHELHALFLKAQLAAIDATAARDRLVTANAATKAKMDKLADAYRFNPERQWTLDEATYALVEGKP